MIEGKAILATIQKRMKKYDSMGLIDPEDVFDFMIKGLKIFGQNIMELQDKVVHVSNGRAVAPKGLQIIKAAYHCDPKGYWAEEGFKDNIQEAIFWKEIKTSGIKWDSCEECCTDTTSDTVVETIYYDDRKVNFYYNNPIPLVPTKSMNRDNCAKEFRRILGYDSPYDLNLRGETIEVNFTKGTIYLRFYGIPMDGEGIPFVPVSQHEQLETYILYYIQRRLMEQWWLNGDVESVQTRIQYLLRMENDTKSLAMTEVKFSTLSPKSFRKIKQMNRLETAKYECMFPTMSEVNQRYGLV